MYFHFRTCLREKEDTRKIIVNKIKNFEMPSKANMCADRPPVYFKLYSKKWLEIGLDPTPQSGGKNYRSAYSKWDKISKSYSMRNSLAWLIFILSLVHFKSNSDTNIRTMWIEFFKYELILLRKWRIREIFSVVGQKATKVCQISIMRTYLLRLSVKLKILFLKLGFFDCTLHTVTWNGEHYCCL